MPYVGEDPFLYILDSWGGQTKQELYDKKFKDSNDLPTCTLKVIPPKCTPICQPCDVYFHRQKDGPRQQAFSQVLATGPVCIYTPLNLSPSVPRV
ncbi:hypothetical protein ANTPLA_LOCUS4678 [Anthophora plagiata]